MTILAAGASRRLGQPKQLVNIDGETLVRRQCRVALESGIGPVAVIVGHEADACIAEVADLPITTCVNEHWREGIASSIRKATQTAINRNAQAMLILQVDQYRITNGDLGSLQSAWIASVGIKACRARCGAYAGPPVIISEDMFGELLKLQGDEGARSVLSRLDRDALIDMEMPNAIHDLDVPSDLAALENGASTYSPARVTCRSNG